MRYHLDAQEGIDWCFPACLQAVLRRYDIETPQEEIAEELGVKGNGVGLVKVLSFLLRRDLDFNFWDHNKTPFNEPDTLLEDSLREGKDVLIAIPNSKGYHVSLLDDFVYPVLSVIDPKDAELKEMDISTLMREMAKGEWMGGFGLIKKL
jgi:hypothetical protein